VAKEQRDGERRQPDDAAEVKTFWPLGHHYSPVPDTRRLAGEDMKRRIWPVEPHPTPGIDWRGEEQLALCEKVFAGQEPLQFARRRTEDETEYWQRNGMYPPLDAWVLQAMLRHLEPARMIEVGCGFSSLVTARVNREFFGGRMRFTCIDPEIRPFLQNGVGGITDIQEQEIQDTPLDVFAELDEGDVLFIDTSHTVKTGGDVPWIYNRILPTLRPGVVVHLHDVFLPGDYPEQWVLEGRAWNEIYLIQSFLAFNSGFEMLFGVRWMMQNHPEALLKAFPDLGPHSDLAGALWIRRV
jgi:predicted O-methyltransferase YrrM